MIRLIEKLREKWKNTFIVIRGDSMFCSPEFMKWAAEQDKVRFITGLSGNSVLNKLTASWVEEARKEYGETGKMKRITALSTIAVAVIALIIGRTFSASVVVVL